LQTRRKWMAGRQKLGNNKKKKNKLK
jgi:hypothetical protein